MAQLTSPLAFVRAFALPILALAFVVVAQMARMTRAALIDQLGRPYAEMARLKGVGRARIVLRHALPNAAGPIANAVALSLSYLFGGAIIVETIFNYPGLASLMVDAVSNRDMPLLQACAMIFCAIYLSMVLVADVLAILSNPRLRHRVSSLPGASASATGRFWVLVAVLGPWLAPHAVGAMVSRDVFDPISAAFPLGSDYLGRDMLSRLLHGDAIHGGTRALRRTARERDGHLAGVVRDRQWPVDRRSR